MPQEKPSSLLSKGLRFLDALCESTFRNSIVRFGHRVVSTKFRRFLFPLVFALPAGAGAASCSLSPAGVVPYKLPGYTATVNAHAANGTVLHSISRNITYPGSSTLTCTPNLGTSTYKATLGATGAYNTYATPVPGVGLRIKFSDNSPPGYWPVSANWSSSNRVTFNQTTYLVFELVKTGPITAGGQITGQIGVADVDYGNFRAATFSINGAIQIVPQILTCKAESPPPVMLGNISSREFTGVGTTTKATPFDIALTCSGGASGAAIGIHTTLTDQTHADNRSDTLSLTPNSTATGLGIQLLRGTTPIKYGQDSSAAGNPNQWLAVGSATNGTYSIPLTGRYIQTAPKVTAGTANGRATFTMSYQ
ncbi:MAG: fimbrial protein [Pseudomonadota bacterium]